MKKLSALFITLFLTLTGISSVFAANADVSGKWDINPDLFPPITIHVVSQTIINGITYTSNYDEIDSMSSLGGVFINVNQTPDGTVTGSTGIPGSFITTINGKVTEDSIAFTEVFTSNDLINNTQRIINATCSGTITTNDPSTSKTINYAYNGSYYYHRVSASGLTTITKTASFSNTASVNILNNIFIPLDTFILSGPTGATTDRNIIFTWIGICSTGLPAGYYYQLDSQPKVFTTATTMTFNNLSYGEHTFSVAAKDNTGNIDPTPATSAFTIGQAAQPNRPTDSNNGEFYSDPQNSVGEPINSVTGNMYIITPDLTLPGKGLNFSFTRTYNSQAASNSNETGPLGYGWTHSYNLYLTQDTQNKLVKIKDEEGKGYLFADNQDGTFISQRGEYSILSKNSSNFIWRKKDGKQYIFDLAGKLIQITDRNNNSLNLAYNSQNQLASIADIYGRKIELAYSQARISSLTDPAGRTFSYNYDNQGNLVTATDPLGNSTTYTYDSRHNLIKKTDARNQSIYYTYDSSNRCTSSSGENNSGRVDLTFDPANHQTTITDSRGNTTIHYYNDDLLITKVKDAQGKEIVSNWDNNFNLISRVDALGRATTMEYDSSGNLTKVTDPDNKITSFTYEPNFNLLLTSTDAQANTTIYTRDALGNPTQITDSENNSTHYTYNSAGQATSNQNALGNSTNFTYDTQGNLTEVKDALGNLATFTYDDAGNLLESKDAQNHTTKFTYDNLNQLTKVTYPDETSVTYTYDAVGNRISSTDALGNTTKSTFDQFQRLTSTTDALGHSINYTYDTEGNLTSLTDQNNNQTAYEYDSLNRLILETDPLGNKKQYQYDSAGNRTSYIDAKNQTTAYEYDKLNRLTKITYPDREVSYTYDSLGRRTSMTEARGTTNYTYDKLGRLTQVDGPAANDTVSYTFDLLGNRLTMTDANNKITSYTYDVLNRLSSITDPQAKVTNYTYDASGNLTNLIYPNATKTTYTYDTLNRLLKLTEQLTSSPYTKLAEFSYTYDKLGRRTQVNLLDGSQINYTYDALGQLTGENKTSSTNPYQISYSYDPLGNRLEMINQGIKHTYSYNSLNQLTEESFSSNTGSTKITVTGRASDPSGIKQIMVNGLTATLAGNNFTCSGVALVPGPNTITVTATDQAGNSTTKILHVTYHPTTKLIYTYDSNGNLISKTGLGDTLNLSYDSSNRLTRFNNTALDETYQYDAEGKRTQKTEVRGQNTEKTSYLYDGLNVIQENSSSGSTNYTRNPNAPGGIGGIIKGLSPQGTVPEIYYHYDGLGSVTNLTNSTGADTQSYSYDSFGNLQGLSPQGTVPNTRQFLTKEADSTGLIYFGARYYDPRLGRFITQDPSGMSDGPNVYVYAGNNPVNYVDAWGLYGAKKTGWWPKELNLFVPGYRLYGGPGRSGPGKPEDQLDTAYETHDVAYRMGKLEEGDIRLVIDLVNLPTNPNDWGNGVNVVYGPVHRTGSLIIFSNRIMFLEILKILDNSQLREGDF